MQNANVANSIALWLVTSMNCGQTVGRIKILLSTEVGLGQHYVFCMGVGVPSEFGVRCTFFDICYPRKFETTQNFQTVLMYVKILVTLHNLGSR